MPLRVCDYLNGSMRRPATNELRPIVLLLTALEAAKRPMDAREICRVVSLGRSACDRGLTIHSCLAISSDGAPADSGERFWSH